MNIVSGDVYVPAWYTSAVRIRQVRDARRTLLRGMRFALRYDDNDFWWDEATAACVQQVFVGMHVLTPQQYGTWLRFGVSEGL